LATKKVKDLGGAVLVTPSKAFHNGNVAIISDNVGAILILQHWSDRTVKGGK
jgi:predicted enzyme related to lactoylglutathione lyase